MGIHCLLLSHSFMLCFLEVNQKSVCCRYCDKGVCVATVAAKECVLLLLQQRSVCCCCYSKGVCVAAIAAKECVLLLLQQRSEVSYVVKGTVFQLFPQLVIRANC
jgi:hypothetical protein